MSRDLDLRAALELPGYLRKIVGATDVLWFCNWGERCMPGHPAFFLDATWNEVHVQSWLCSQLRHALSLSRAQFSYL